MSEQAIEPTEENTLIDNAGADDVEESAVETKAREMGWKPEDEWVGDKSRHLTAEQFVDRNEFLQSKATNIAKAEISRLEGEVSGLKTTIKDLGAHLKKADQRALERARKELEGQMDAAVEEGDVEAYNEAKKGISDLNTEVEEAVEEAKPEPTPDNDPNFIAWTEKNSWYGPDGDIEATLHAEEIAPVVGRKYQGEEFYEQIAKRVESKFPHLFETPGDKNRRKPSAVEGAGNSGGGGSTGLWSKVDKEGRDAFKRFVAEKLFEDTKEDREKYAQDYVDE